jgi:hypothetical protein
MTRSHSGGIDFKSNNVRKNDVPRRIVLAPLANLFHVMEG